VPGLGELRAAGLIDNRPGPAPLFEGETENEAEA
jgi:hypothetical protein